MIKQKIKEDSVIALKAGDRKKVDVLRYVLSLIDKKELSMPLGKMTEEDEMAVLRKELKNKKEAMEMFAKGGRDDLVADSQEEIDILSSYMPEEVSNEEIKKKVVEVVAVKGANFGLVMGEVMKSFGGRVDGSVVSGFVREEIGKTNE